MADKEGSKVGSRWQFFKKLARLKYCILLDLSLHIGINLIFFEKSRLTYNSNLAEGQTC